MNVYEQLQAIHNRHGVLTPGIVVSEAANPEHPLHARFEWDDTQAAERWRLNQAQALIRSVNVQIETTEQRIISVRAYISKSEMGRGDDTDNPETGIYVDVHEVVASDVMRTAWFRALAKDWQRLKAKAGASQEFAQMVMDDMRQIAS